MRHAHVRRVAGNPNERRAAHANGLHSGTVDPIASDLLVVVWVDGRLRGVHVLVAQYGFGVTAAIRLRRRTRRTRPGRRRHRKWRRGRRAAATEDRQAPVYSTARLERGMVLAEKVVVVQLRARHHKVVTPSAAGLDADAVEPETVCHVSRVGVVRMRFIVAVRESDERQRVANLGPRWKRRCGRRWRPLGWRRVERRQVGRRQVGGQVQTAKRQQQCTITAG